MLYPEKHFLLSAIEVTDVTSKKTQLSQTKACKEVGEVIAHTVTVVVENRRLPVLPPKQFQDNGFSASSH
jgi:hypothetical protein